MGILDLIKAGISGAKAEKEMGGPKIEKVKKELEALHLNLNNLKQEQEAIKGAIEMKNDELKDLQASERISFKKAAREMKSSSAFLKKAKVKLSSQITSVCKEITKAIDNEIDKYSESNKVEAASKTNMKNYIVTFKTKSLSQLKKAKTVKDIDSLSSSLSTIESKLQGRDDLYGKEAVEAYVKYKEANKTIDEKFNKIVETVKIIRDKLPNK